MKPYICGNRSLQTLAALLACGLAGAPALAQTSADPSTEAEVVDGDIIVTATRRAEPLRKVPIAISVVSGDVLRQENRNSLQSIAAVVPSLNFRTVASAKDQALFIRGLGTVSTSPGVEPTVSTIIDGVVLARQGQASMDLLDVDRLEVLRGPQGTLFGKNASVGAVNIVAAAPGDSLHGFVDAAYYSGGDEWRARAGVSGPLVADKLAGSLTAAYSHYAGNVTNIHDGKMVNGFENKGVRGKLLFTPSETVTLSLIADYSDATSTSPQGVVTRTYRTAYPTNAVTQNPAFAAALAPIAPTDDNRQINSNYDGRAFDENYGVSAQLDLELGDYVLTSISAWRGWKNTQYQDQDRLRAPIASAAQMHDIGWLDFNQYSQELRLASPKGGFVDYVVGLFYFQGDNAERYQRVTTLSSGTSYLGVADFGVKNRSYAGFAEANLHFTDAFRATLGGRVTRDDLSYRFDRTSSSATAVSGIQTAFSASGKTDATGFSARAGVQYDLSRFVMSYVSYGRGYKGPAYNLAFSMLPQDTGRLKPETSDAFEIGLKSRLLGDLLHLDIAAFLDKFRNYQVNFFDTYNGSPVTRLINAGKVSTRGVEIDLTSRPAEGFTLSAGGAYTDARIDNFICPAGTNASCQVNGMPLPYAPKWKGNMRASYRHALNDNLAIRLTTDANVQSKVQYSINQTPDTVQSAYGIWNASIGLVSISGLELNFVVKNITDRSYASNLQTFGQGVVRWVPRDDGRYVGVNAHFGF